MRISIEPNIFLPDHKFTFNEKIVFKNIFYEP